MAECSLSSFGYPHAKLMDEKQWLTIVRESIEEERSKSSSKVSIFIVPKVLSCMAPQCYTTQHVALGPNHYWRPELHDTEGYKIAAAKKVQWELRSRNLDFEGLVKQFKDKHEADTRACYQRFIYFHSDTLAWVMAVDTAFLLEFLQVIYAVKEFDNSMMGLSASHVHDNVRSYTAASGVILSVDEDEVRMKAHALSLFTSHMIDYAGNTAFRNAIVRDIVMLENQIPRFLLKEMVMIQCSLSEEPANSILFSMLKALGKEVCPFKFMANSPRSEISKRAHLLDYMYRMILPHVEESSAPEKQTKTEEHKDDEDKEISCQNFSLIIQVLFKVKNLLPQPNIPRTLPSMAPAIEVVVNSLCSQENKGLISEDNNDTNKAPEIDIPSATDLQKAGIQFSPIRNGKFPHIITFDSKRGRLKLPEITLDENTEVILRNLVAYEASNPSGSRYFTRYTELIYGIIDTAEDVKVLKEGNVILNNLTSDEEATKLWNGMSRSIRSTQVAELDKVIEEVNKYYNRLWMVKVKRCLKRYVYVLGDFSHCWLHFYSCSFRRSKRFVRSTNATNFSCQALSELAYSLTSLIYNYKCNNIYGSKFFN